MILGPFHIEHPFILAPMAGITHSSFRRLMKTHGSALLVSELISAYGIEYTAQRTLDLLRFYPDEHLIGLQIFGENADILCRACQYIEKLGADFIDLNLGCPVPKVVKKGAGSALCRDPVSLGKILCAMVKSVHIPITIKIRTGWDAHSRNALDVVHAASDAGVSWVAIHGRTRAQGYQGEADWEFIGNIKAKSSIPILGNGDLSTPEIALKRYQDYAVDAVLIGRGALRNPFIFEQAVQLWKGQQYRVAQMKDYLSFMREQRSFFSEQEGEKRAMVHARKFLAWYATGFPGCHEFRKKIFSIQDEDAFWNESFQFFEKTCYKRDFEFLDQPFLMGGHG